MDLTIQRMLDEEYKRTLEELSQAKTGSDEAKWALHKLAELHKQMMENKLNENKCCVETRTLDLKEREMTFKERQAKEQYQLDAIANDNKFHLESQKIALEDRETALKEQQAEEGKLWTIVRIVIDGVAIVLPIWASWTWMARGLQFEKTGTFTSRTGNWLSNHFRLFKK